MAAPLADARGLIRESDHEARQRLINEREKLFALSRRIDASLAEYDALIGNAGYPAAGRAFDRAYAAMCRSAFAVFHADELLDIADAYDPDAIAEDQAKVCSIDERFGTCSWIAS